MRSYTVTFKVLSSKANRRPAVLRVFTAIRHPDKDANDPQIFCPAQKDPSNKKYLKIGHGSY